MITRKAIVTAFEVLSGDKQLHTVTVFCSAKNIPVLKTERVRLTRRAKSKNEYLLTVGKMNFREREYARREAAKGRLPKLLLKAKPKTKRKAK